MSYLSSHQKYNHAAVSVIPEVFSYPWLLMFPIPSFKKNMRFWPVQDMPGTEFYKITFF